MGCEYPGSKAHQGISAPLEKSIIKIGEQRWQVEIADTPQARQTGLMFREKLEVGTGMFFVFDREDFHAFWMKNTPIPLDIIWISSDRKVVDIQTLYPCGNADCPNFAPQGKAQYALEINAGAFKGVIGNQVLFE